MCNVCHTFGTALIWSVVSCRAAEHIISGRSLADDWRCVSDWC